MSRKHSKNRMPGCLVNDEQEYRLLVFDRKRNSYVFIEKRDRNKEYMAVVLNKEVQRCRYEVIRAYMFPKGTNYPEFYPLSMKSSTNIAYEWADDKCVERREVPERWKAEINDLNSNHISEYPDILKQAHRKEDLVKQACDPYCCNEKWEDYRSTWYNHAKDDLEYHI